MSLEADFGVSLVASLNGLASRIGEFCDRMDREVQFRQAATQAFRSVPFIINVPLVAGASTINPSVIGPDIGYYWSIRKLAAVGFTAGTVNTYVDAVNGEPIVPFPQAGVATFGKMEQLINPNSSVAVSATGITGTVQIWGKADQFEAWLLPWYGGAQRDG